MPLYECMATDGKYTAVVYLIAASRDEAREKAWRRARYKHFGGRPTRINYCSCIKNCENTASG